MNKLIGFSARILYEDKVRKQFVNERYLVPFINKGFNTIMLTLDNPNIESLLEMCDGFVVTGGHDIDPSYFNEENNGESKGCDPALDQLDCAIVTHAAKNKKPLLGICRGHQAINVFMGGSLYQDIGKSHSGTKHQVSAASNRYFDFPHQFETNSWHHQSLKEVAPCFDVFVRSEDNTIEAIIHRELPMIGFQWHPEMMASDPISQEIFSKFALLISKNS
ncbi:MAG: type 1 glutamine amidotransferase [Bacilli bacterium]|jgi:putative glutamine amidotransferase|nr:type 1 glutamine amidotransferase [Bacilli bacterium]MDY0063462.1 type 1 glutamine amidotransferase [Bacilli bacterium]